MHHRLLEKELIHLEYVVERISTDNAIPLIYWKSRLARLNETTILPAHRVRLTKLHDALHAIEQARIAATRARSAIRSRRKRRA